MLRLVVRSDSPRPRRRISICLPLHGRGESPFIVWPLVLGQSVPPRIVPIRHSAVGRSAPSPTPSFLLATPLSRRGERPFMFCSWNYLESPFISAVVIVNCSMQRHVILHPTRLSALGRAELFRADAFLCSSSLSTGTVSVHLCYIDAVSVHPFSRY